MSKSDTKEIRKVQNENTVSQEETITEQKEVGSPVDPIKEIAEKIQAQLKSGKTMEEALRDNLPQAHKGSVARVDRIAYIQGLVNIEEVRKARKVAYAKKSKSSGKADASARYDAEIKAAGDRLNELLAEVNSAQVPWKRALELGETVTGAFQIWLVDKEGELNKLLTGTAKSQLKQTLTTLQPSAVGIPAEFQDLFQKRLSTFDQRVLTLGKKIALSETLLKPVTEKTEKAENTQSTEQK